MSIRRLGFIALLWGALGVTAAAQQFIPLPQNSWAKDISADGRVVVGTWDPNNAFIWRWQEEAEPTIVFGGDFVAVSDDGSVIAGNAFDSSVGAVVASVWTESGGWQHLGGIPGVPACGNSYSTAYDISADGSTVVGLGWNGCNGRGFRWTQATGMQELQNLVNGNNRCSAIAGDGSLLGGFAQGTSNRTPAYWGPNTLGFVLDADMKGEVFGIDGTGTRSVGTAYFSGIPYTAFVRDNTTGIITKLGNISTTWSGKARDLSEDGDTIVGYDSSGTSRRAWIWTTSGGMVLIDDLLPTLGFNGVLPVWTSSAVSDDGNVIVGGGEHPNSVFPFVAFGGYILALGETTWTDLDNGLAGTGGLTPQLFGGGGLTSGSTVSLSLSDARPLSPAWIVLGVSELSAPFKGGVMVPDTDVIIGPVNTDAAGELELHLPWPAGLPSGVQTWWQEWIQDPAGPVGFAASNGIKGVTP